MRVHGRSVCVCVCVCVNERERELVMRAGWQRATARAGKTYFYFRSIHERHWKMRTRIDAGSGRRAFGHVDDASGIPMPPKYY